MNGTTLSSILAIVLMLPSGADAIRVKLNPWNVVENQYPGLHQHAQTALATLTTENQ